MNQTLPGVIAGILTYNGAVVEKDADGSLEVVFPPEASKTLGLPEYARLNFSYGESSGDAIYASYDSEFFRSIRNLFTDRGRYAIGFVEPTVWNLEKLSRVIKEKIVLGNATFRLDKTDTSEIYYSLIFFKYIALSDEKHEGILPLLINELNLSSISFEFNMSELKEKLKEQNKRQEKEKEQKCMKVLQAAHTSAIRKVEKSMEDFIKSLERRLNRDIKRVHEYYETLKTEAKTTIERKVASPGQQNGIGELRNKLDIIEAEQRWKIQDLMAKYTLNIKVEPAAIIRIRIQAPVFRLNIKRRLASRQFPATYNPIVRHFDPLPCESCFNPHGVSYICDDKLHIVCGNCFGNCSSCRKRYCKACHGGKCPRCKK